MRKEILRFFVKIKDFNQKKRMMEEKEVEA